VVVRVREERRGRADDADPENAQVGAVLGVALYVLPRVGSFSWYVDPETVVSNGTVPPYSD